MFGFTFTKAAQIRQMRKAERAMKYAQEQAAKPKSKVEQLARAYCEELGYDPDERVSVAPCAFVTRWRLYRDKAEAELYRAAMDTALVKVGE